MGARLLFRTDAGVVVGAGHYRRSLALAVAMRSAGAQPTMIIAGDVAPREDCGVPVRYLDGFDAEMIDTLRAANELQIDGLFVDSYVVTASALARAANAYPLTVLDDMADRRIPESALVINAAPGAASLSYPGSAPRLLGPAYALVRPGLVEEPAPVRSPVTRVVVQIGGADARGISPALVQATRAALPNAHIDVVAGPFFPPNVRKQLIQMEMADGLVSVHHDPEDLVTTLRRADIAVIGGGQSTYETAAAGVPTLAILLAPNQAPNLAALVAGGVLLWIGDAEDPVLPRRVQAALQVLAEDQTTRAGLSRAGRRLIDGRGAERAATRILSWLEVR